MRILRVLGLVVCTLWLVGAIFAFVKAGSNGEPQTYRFECHRSTGTCTSTYPLIRPTVTLSDITGVELGSTKEGLGRGAHVETQSFVQLKLKTGSDLGITPATADRESVEGYKKELSQIQAFLAGTDADLSISVGSRDSNAKSDNGLATGILSLILSIVGFVLLLRWKPGAK